MRRAARTQARHSERLSRATTGEPVGRCSAAHTSSFASSLRSTAQGRSGSHHDETPRRVAARPSPPHSLAPQRRPSSPRRCCPLARSARCCCCCCRARARARARSRARGRCARSSCASSRRRAASTRSSRWFVVLFGGASLSLRMTWHIRVDSPLTTSAARRPSSSTRSSRCGSFSGRLTPPSHNTECCVSPFTRRALHKNKGRSRRRPWCAREDCAAPLHREAVTAVAYAALLRRRDALAEHADPPRGVRRAQDALRARGGGRRDGRGTRGCAAGGRWRRSSATVVGDAGRHDGRGRGAVRARGRSVVFSGAAAVEMTAALRRRALTARDA